MRRRSFLELALLLPFARRALGDASLPPAGGQKNAPELDGALDRARRSSRPLLVLVIPEKDELKWDRDAAFGELLNHGSDFQIAPLSRVEVAAATMAEVRARVPSVPTGEPAMLYVQADQRAALATSGFTLKQYPSWHRGDDGRSWEQRLKDEDKIADERINALAGSLRVSLGLPDDIPAAAAEVRRRVTHRRVPGSHWAHGSGCGTQIEESEREKMMPDCGMGHVPSKSARFLYFWATK
jgi:hypothetical protein